MAERFVRGYVVSSELLLGLVVRRTPMLFPAAGLSLLILVWPLAARGDDAELARVFEKHHARGTLVLSQLTTGAEHVHDQARARRRFTPASTFKIPNTLIALEEGVIDERQVLRWDGVKRARSEWNRDHTLESAFRVSCVWCYQALARKIGPTRYRTHLARMRYGNAAPGREVTLFWLDGSLQISAVEQVAFLRALLARKLPFKASSYDALARIMVLERGRGYVLSAKTGWSKETKPELGWLVGEVAASGARWVFAMNLDLASDADAAKRLVITREALRAKRIIP